MEASLTTSGSEPSGKMDFGYHSSREMLMEPMSEARSLASATPKLANDHKETTSMPSINQSQSKGGSSELSIIGYNGDDNPVNDLRSLEEALISISEEPPHVARSTPKGIFIDTSKFSNQQHCIYQPEIYDSMLQDSLDVCSMLQDNLDSFIEQAACVRQGDDSDNKSAVVAVERLLLNPDSQPGTLPRLSNSSIIRRRPITAESDIGSSIAGSISYSSRPDSQAAGFQSPSITPDSGNHGCSSDDAAQNNNNDSQEEILPVSSEVLGNNGNDQGKGEAAEKTIMKTKFMRLIKFGHF